MSEDFDLFGEPVPPGRGKRGRPQHVPTQENRNKIIVLMAMGWTNERVANALRITVPTLRKHYFAVLKLRDQARDRVDGVRLMMIWNQMREGNVAAMKEYARLVERLDIQAAQSAYGDAFGEGAPVRKRPLGKKEQDAIDARTAGLETEWGADLLGSEEPTQH